MSEFGWTLKRSPSIPLLYCKLLHLDRPDVSMINDQSFGAMKAFTSPSSTMAKTHPITTCSSACANWIKINQNVGSLIIARESFTLLNRLIAAHRLFSIDTHTKPSLNRRKMKVSGRHLETEPWSSFIDCLLTHPILNKRAQNCVTLSIAISVWIELVIVEWPPVSKQNQSG